MQDSNYKAYFAKNGHYWNAVDSVMTYGHCFETPMYHAHSGKLRTQYFNTNSYIKNVLILVYF